MTTFTTTHVPQSTLDEWHALSSRSAALFNRPRSNAEATEYWLIEDELAAVFRKFYPSIGAFKNRAYALAGALSRLLGKKLSVAELKALQKTYVDKLMLCWVPPDLPLKDKVVTFFLDFVQITPEMPQYTNAKKIVTSALTWHH